MIHNPIIYIVRKSPPSSSPISLELIKSFLKANSAFEIEEKFLLNLISMATEYAEWYMEKSLMHQKWMISCNGYIPQKIPLIFNPIINIESIYSIHQNENHLINPEDYYLDHETSYVIFKKIPNTQKINITYEAGYANSELIPTQIKQGLLHHVAMLYKNREAEDIDSLSRVKTFYNPFRAFKLVL